MVAEPFHVKHFLSLFHLPPHNADGFGDLDNAEAPGPVAMLQRRSYKPPIPAWRATPARKVP